MDNPSSLIFVALVVVWAGWLLQHQIRRRQVLLTARTVETFSDAMRVLERREQVGDSNADHRTSLRAGTIVHAMRDEQVQLEQPDVPDQPSEVDMPTQPSVSEKLQSVLSRVPSLQASRRTRGIAFLGAVAVFPITLIAVLAGAITPLALLGSLMLIAAVVAWLRSEAVAARSGVMQSRPARSVQPRQAGAKSRPVRQASAQPVIGQDRLEAPQEVAGANEDVPFDAQPAPVAEQVEMPAPQALAESFQDDCDAGAPAAIADGTWSPVQVPKPTYTMKAKAPERAAPEPASYQNMPVEDLPFDGHALDLEDEDLPPVFRAG